MSGRGEPATAAVPAVAAGTEHEAKHQHKHKHKHRHRHRHRSHRDKHGHRSHRSHRSSSSRHHGAEASSVASLPPASPPAATGRSSAQKGRLPPHLAKIHEFVCRQIWQRVAKESDIQRRVNTMFGRPVGYITFPIFKHYLHQTFGVRLSEEDARILFAAFDINNSGRISVAELIRVSQVPDYSTPLWNVERDKEERRKEAEALHKPAAAPITALPATLKRNKWNLAKIEQAINRKLVERTRRPETQYLQAYRIFDKPQGSLSPAEFRHRLSTMGIVLDDDDLAGFVAKYDVDGSGNVDWRTFITTVLPNDYEEPDWSSLRQDEMAAAMDVHVPAATLQKEWPKSLKGCELNVDQYIALIRAKLIARTRRPQDQFRKSYQLFGMPANGITLREFAEGVRKLGIVASDDVTAQLFKRVDSNHNGKLDFPELVQHIMGDDFSANMWYVKRGKQIEKQEVETKKKIRGRPVLTKFPESLKHVKPKFEDLLLLMQQKLLGAAKRPSDQYREVYRMFGAPEHGVSKANLSQKLGNMNIVVSDEELDQFFDYFDLNANGMIDFQEMVKTLMPTDFPLPTYVALRDEENRKREAEAHKKWKEEAPFGKPLPGATGWQSCSARLETNRSESDETMYKTAAPIPKHILEAQEAAYEMEQRRRRQREKRFPVKKLHARSKKVEDNIVARRRGELVDMHASAPELRPPLLRASVTKPRQPVMLCSKQLQGTMHAQLTSPVKAVGSMGFKGHATRGRTMGGGFTARSRMAASKSFPTLGAKDISAMRTSSQAVSSVPTNVQYAPTY